MKTISCVIPFLLLAGAGLAQASPLVKITTPNGECDVTPSGGEIFHLDLNGNVLITGTLSGAACGDATPPDGTVSFTSPMQFGNSSIASGGSTWLAYTALNATGCTVATPTGTATPSGTCPAVSISNGGCSGSGSGGSCTASGSISESEAFASNTTQACNYTVKATCSPGSVTSSAVLQVTNPNYSSGGGGSGDPAACKNVAQIGTGTGQFWSRVLTTNVTYGGGGTSKTGVNATDYLQIWSVPGTSPAWPGNFGVTTRPTASVNQYFAEKFVVPTDGIVTRANWAWSGSGINTNMSLAISVCPGDFGQTNSQVTTGCKLKKANSANGLTVLVDSAQQGSACTLIPGKTYYLNVLPEANLPVGDISTSGGCSASCTPWLGLN
jgi:hypothetical protein